MYETGYHYSGSCVQDGCLDCVQVWKGMPGDQDKWTGTTRLGAKDVYNAWEQEDSLLIVSNTVRIYFFSNTKASKLMHVCPISVSQLSRAQK